MRLAAQQRGGFYPAHPDAIMHVLTYSRAPAKQAFTVLDPCAGEGAALSQLADQLGCPPSNTYAIELDEGRAQTLKSALPDAHVLAPASFFGCRASRNSFSFIWLNPPFDHAYGGNRVEEQFLQQATEWLMPGGVLAFVCPEDVVDEYSDTRQHFATYYENCQIVPFPEICRPFKEVVVLAHKRARPHANRWNPWEDAQAPPNFLWRIPPGAGPRIFKKVEPTENELKHMLAHSPLRSHLEMPKPFAIPVPPLALGIGHIALLLASGHLNGVVHPQSKPAHVVRGSSRKCEYVSEVAHIDNADGTTSTRTTISERIELVVRTVDAGGRLQTFLDTHSENEEDASP